MAELHRFLAILRVVHDLGGHVTLDGLQPRLDPAQVAGNFGEHQAAAAAVCG